MQILQFGTTTLFSAILDLNKLKILFIDHKMCQCFAILLHLRQILQEEVSSKTFTKKNKQKNVLSHTITAYISQ